jgi:ABC-type transport system involved in cytochrome c biogenesis permease subunit
MNTTLRYLPWGVTGLAALYLALVSLPPRPADGTARVDDFGQLPISDHGRVKPIDTLARISLMVISGRQTYGDDIDKTQPVRTDGRGNLRYHGADGNDIVKTQPVRTEPAIKWLLDVVTNGTGDSAAMKEVWEQKLFHVEDAALVKVLKLEEKPGSLYSLTDLAPHLGSIFRVAAELQSVEPEQRNPSIRAILHLANHIRLVHTLAGRQDKVFRIENDQVLALLDLEPRSGLRYGAGEFVTKLGPLLQQNNRARAVEVAKRDLFDQKILELGEHISMYVQLTEPENLYAVPPESPGEEWKELGRAGRKNAVVQAWADMLSAYQKDDPAEFNRAVADYRASLRASAASDERRASFEVFFNNFAPFYQCAILYVLVLVLACAGWIANLGFLQRTAFWLGALTLAVHTAALVARMYLSDRWLVFVTNLYSSAVFIGWMSVLLGLILERIYGNGLGNALAGLTGFASLIVAHHLGSDGDTLEMLQAVLDTNFWLATHVTSVTIGYASTFVAGFLGIAYIVAGVFTRALQKDGQRALSQMIYGIVCFATLFSFTGTVLGGIWADQSWGRFWGWDPKENGALLIVLWNALILHARWGGLVKQRGIAVLAVVGNMVTGWSWFGTNQLGVGLHAYGFNNTLALGLTIFWIVNLGFIGLGLLPLSMWRSFVLRQPEPPASTPSKPEPLARDRRGVSTAVTPAS